MDADDGDSVFCSTLPDTDTFPSFPPPDFDSVEGDDAP